MTNINKTYNARNHRILHGATGARRGVHAAEDRLRAGARTGAAT